MPSLSGKVGLITGGAQGLGRAFCEALLKNGAKVCILDVNEDQGKKTLADFTQKYGKGSAEFFKCDVTSQQEMEDAFAFTKNTFGGVDIVCNNAGIAHEQAWDRMIQINLIGVVRGTMLGIDYMSKEKGGRGGVIVSVASIVALAPSHIFPGYSAAKAGVVALTRSWANNVVRLTLEVLGMTIEKEYIKKYSIPVNVRKNPSGDKMGVRFHAICPAHVETDLIEFAHHHCIDEDGFRDILKDSVPMTPETVGEAFLQLVYTDDRSGDIMAVTPEGTRLIPESNPLA